MVETFHLHSQDAGWQTKPGEANTQRTVLTHLWSVLCRAE